MKIEHAIKSTKPIPLPQKTVINIFYTSNSIKEDFSRFFKSYGLSMEQYNVLRILRGQKGTPANMSTLQERMINKMSNTTRLVDKLIVKELVTRNTCPSNRRKIEILITNKGLNIMKQIDDKLDIKENNLTKNLTNNELETLNNLLDKIRL
ncbi:MarR family winged helix-turn-helix transcriptional regulator [Pontimicrobium sp. MEBiC06410]